MVQSRCSSNPRSWRQTLNLPLVWHQGRCFAIIGCSMCFPHIHLAGPPTYINTQQSISEVLFKHFTDENDFICDRLTSGQPSLALPLQSTVYHTCSADRERDIFLHYIPPVNKDKLVVEPDCCDVVLFTLLLICCTLTKLPAQAADLLLW